jgi:flagellar basal-body rod protein FlgC
MTDPLAAAFSIASSGLRAQSFRLRVVSENIANASVTATTPGGDPYRRKVPLFEVGNANKQPGVAVSGVAYDTAPFRQSVDPSNPAADAQGNVKLPNVDLEVELADMRDANRSYQAALQSFRQAQQMFNQTIEELKG